MYGSQNENGDRKREGQFHRLALLNPRSIVQVEQVFIRLAIGRKALLMFG